MTVGEAIKYFRKKNKLTQKQLATKAGMAEITIRQYEAVKREPRLEQLHKIAEALNVLNNLQKSLSKKVKRKYLTN